MRRGREAERKKEKAKEVNKKWVKWRKTRCGEEGGWGGKEEKGKEEEAEVVGGAPGWPVSGSYFACVCWSTAPAFCCLPFPPPPSCPPPSPCPSGLGAHVLSSSEVQLALQGRG